MSNNQQPIEYKPTKYGIVGKQELTKEMKESYLDYAMSVIVSRALPDVRDGLKPVHRRILYAMWELGLKHKAKYRKSATVVGEVLGKYHPHGDMAVYESLVRMAQDFAMRAPLVNGQGNFGSMDGDSAAAMRYTEAKMEAIAEELLYDISKDTVDFVPNYDSTRKEPVVLPGKFPNLLVNGALGIAVGMATNIPPHNLAEIIDASVALIDEPELENEKLLELVPGPDFPTGGHIYGQEPIKQAYSTGKGSILMRAVTRLEQPKNARQRIIISELPYQVNKAELISKIANLVKSKKLDGIADIRDESDRKEGVRIVIILKKKAYPKKILNQLYKLTPMQTSFYVNMVALVDGIQPKLLSLREIILQFISHRRNVVTRRVKFNLKQAKDREHILQGLKKALDEIDAIISTIRESKDAKIAKTNLVANFKLTDLQAEAILEMRLSALAGLERQQVLDELAEKIALIKKLQDLLEHPKKIDKKIKKELTIVKEKFATPRRTKIFKRAIGDFSLEDLVPNEYVIITLTKGDYIKRQLVETYRAQNRGGKGIIGMKTKDEDQVEYLTVANTHDDIFFFTDAGRVFKAKVYDLPESTRQAKGQPLAGLIQLGPEEKVTAIVSIAHDKQTELKGFLLMSTEQGTVKKTPVEKYTNIRSSGIIAIRLKNNDKLSFVKLTSGADNVMITTLHGQGIYFKETDVRPMGRSASGVRGIKLRPDDRVIAMDIVRKKDNSDLLTVLENGYGKRTNISQHFHPQKRGGLGLRVSRTNAKTGPLVTARVLNEIKGDLVIISRKGQVIRMKLASAKRLGRNTMGVRLMKLKANDKIASVVLVQKQEKIIEKLDEALEKQPTEKNPTAKASIKSSSKGKGKAISPKAKSKLKTPAQKNPPTHSKPKKSSQKTSARKSGKKKNKKSPSSPNYWGGKNSA